MAQSELNLQIIDEFRANGGQVLHERFRGGALLLLTTTGRATGEPRTTPVGYRMNGGEMYIHTVNAGRPQIPQWYWNLAANPDVTLELGEETYRARAVLMSEQESERLLAEFAAADPRMQPVLDRMAAEAAPERRRRIPIVRVERL